MLLESEKFDIQSAKKNIEVQLVLEPKFVFLWYSLLLVAMNKRDIWELKKKDYPKLS